MSDLNPEAQPWVVGEILEEKARQNRGRVFLYYKDETVTCDELNANANRVANGLLAMGVGKGDKVCIMLPNCPQYLYTWFGLAKIGAVEVPINNALRGYGLKYVINHSEAKVAVADRQFFEALKFVEHELDNMHDVVAFSAEPFDGEVPPVRFHVTPYERLLDQPATTPQVPVRHSDLMSIIYTSGTTGASKGVMLPHNYAGWHGSVRKRVMRVTADDILYTCLPLFHINAQLITTMTALISDAQVALSPRFSASRFWDEIRRYRATEFNFIGGMAPMLYNQPPRPDDGQHSVRLAMGAPVPRDLYADFVRRFNLHILEGFGMSELSPGLFMPYDQPRRNCMGLPITGHEAKVVDDDDCEVAPHIIGELVFRPTLPYSMMLGYYRMPEKTLEAFRNLWFHTGDFAYRDEDGYFYFVDRKKDAIRRRGENISSFEVEAVVNSHDAVAESAAFAVPSELGEDDVKVVVVLISGANLKPEDLIAYCEKRMARFALPRYLEFSDSLPKTATMRIEKYRLRENWSNAQTWDREREQPSRASRR